MNMKSAALYISSLVFLLMTIGHFLRLHKGWSIVFDNFTVPVEWSMYAGIVGAVLTLWTFFAARSR